MSENKKIYLAIGKKGFHGDLETYGVSTSRERLVKYLKLKGFEEFKDIYNKHVITCDEKKCNILILDNI